MNNNVRNKLAVKRLLYRIRMGEDEPLEDYLSRFYAQAQEVQALDPKFSEEEVALILISSLSDRYENVVTSITCSKEVLILFEVMSILRTNSKHHMLRNDLPWYMGGFTARHHQPTSQVQEIPLQQGISTQLASQQPSITQNLMNSTQPCLSAPPTLPQNLAAPSPQTPLQINYPVQTTNIMHPQQDPNLNFSQLPILIDTSCATPEIDCAAEFTALIVLDSFLSPKPFPHSFDRFNCRRILGGTTKIPMFFPYSFLFRAWALAIAAV